MAKNKKQLPVLEQVMVTDLAAEGKEHCRPASRYRRAIPLNTALRL